MPTPIGVVPLTYKGTDLQRSDYTVFLEIVRGLDEVTDVRGQDTVIPSLAGRVARNRVADRRSIELRGWVSGTGATEELARSSYRTLVKELQTLFSPTAAAGNLVATLEDGTTATISARSLSIMWGDPVVPSHRPLSVELESIAPNWTIT